MILNPTELPEFPNFASEQLPGNFTSYEEVLQLCEAYLPAVYEAQAKYGLRRKKGEFPPFEM